MPSMHVDMGSISGTAEKEQQNRTKSHVIGDYLHCILSKTTPLSSRGSHMCGIITSLLTSVNLTHRNFFGSQRFNLKMLCFKRYTERAHTEYVNAKALDNISAHRILEASIFKCDTDIYCNYTHVLLQ